jgi:hypothetical protein
MRIDLPDGFDWILGRPESLPGYADRYRLRHGRFRIV